MPQEKLPPPWIIEKIKKREEEKRRREQEQPQIPLYDDRPIPENPPDEEPRETIINPGKNEEKSGDNWFQM